MKKEPRFIVSDNIKIDILRTISNNPGIAKSGIKSYLKLGKTTLDSAIFFWESIGAIEGKRSKSDGRGKVGLNITNMGNIILHNIEQTKKSDLTESTISNDLDRLVKILIGYTEISSLHWGEIDIIENCIQNWEGYDGIRKKEAIKQLARSLGQIYDRFQDNPEALRIYAKILLTAANEL